MYVDPGRGQSLIDTDRWQPGDRIFDRSRGRERIVHECQILGRVMKLWLKDPSTGLITQATYPVDEVASRFEIVHAQTSAFSADSAVVAMVAEAYRLQHAYLFNPVFATETSLIDPLPHQLLAVYGMPRTDGQQSAQRGMLDYPRLRFLLADDAGAGKTIMSGLYIREMLLRRLIERVLVVAPAGLVGNWQRELRNLFRLRFRILGSVSNGEENPFDEINLAIISLDTLRQSRMRELLRGAPPYDLVVFDEAHKLSARRTPDLTPDKSKRYEVAEEIALQGRHLLLLTATPHMGKDDPYYFLWRLLEPELLSSMEAFNKLSHKQRSEHLLRRMKEEMVTFDGRALYPDRDSVTITYPLSSGQVSERTLYDQTTSYCELHFDKAKRNNRQAAGLAMSVLQRRLASSTWALLRSLERRHEKLVDLLESLQTGLRNRAAFEAQQIALPTVSVRDVKTGDEEEVFDGLEESDLEDDELAGATDAVDVEELRREVDEVRNLVYMARAVYDRKDESKFNRLWKALHDYPDTKALIFTEHRDTLDFLVGRFEGLGFTGKIARIHGAMDYKEREEQAEFFRRPASEGGAQYMVATDAAGEGINLQFCWPLVNYDIPWNPARIEQRMGRVHRYKQRHDVLLLNLVAENTREGRVLKVLLDKLERIRKELGTDKVFDVIGEQFTNVSLSDLLFKAVVEGQVHEAEREIDRVLSPEAVEAQLLRQRTRVEATEVRRLLDALTRRREDASLFRMMPAYVRRFFERIAPLVGVEVVGDSLSVFGLGRCPESVRRALERYPAELQDRLTFNREIAMPPEALVPQAIYLHPGEEVFEAVTTLFLGKYGNEGERGGLFFDDASTEPYIFYLVKVPVIREVEEPTDSVANGVRAQILEEAMFGVRRTADSGCEAVPAHLLLDLVPADSGKVPPASIDLVGTVDDVAPVEQFVYETQGTPILSHLRAEAETRLPERRRQIVTSYGLREAELLEQRRKLKEAVAKGEPAAKTKLVRCETEYDALEEGRAAAEARLLSEIDQMSLGPVTIYARALVLPLPEEQSNRRRDDYVEAVAMREAIAYEEALGALVEDVSNPMLRTGFDLRSTRPDGTVLHIEVKGRAGVGEVELTEHEWHQAENHQDRYHLYVVYNCKTQNPQLHRVPNPFGKGIDQPKGGVTIEATDIMSVAEREHE